MFTEEVSLPDGLSSFLDGVGAEIIINIMIKVIIVLKLMMIMGVNRRMIKKRSRDLLQIPGSDIVENVSELLPKTEKKEDVDSNISCQGSSSYHCSQKKVSRKK